MTARHKTLARLGTGLVGMVTLASVTPLLALLAAGAIADAFGCVLDEGSVHRCVIWGRDLGGVLYTAFVGGWLTILTAPVMLACAAFWMVYGVARICRRRRAPLG